MKTLASLLFLLFTYGIGNAQTPSFKAGDRMKLGAGSMKNKDFKYVFLPANDEVRFKKINLKADHENSTIEILRMTGSGKKTTLIVAVDGDSVPAQAKEAYADFERQLNETVATMEKELQDRQTEFTNNEKKYSESEKGIKKKELEDLKKRISEFKAAVSEENKRRKEECYALRWTVELDAALNAGEIQK
jgi:hypothetical protein